MMVRKYEKHQQCIVNYLSQYHRHQLKGQVDSISTQIKLYHFYNILTLFGHSVPLNISGLRILLPIVSPNVSESSFSATKPV